MSRSRRWPSLRRPSVAAAVLAALMLVVSLGTQDAMAFAVTKAPRHLADPEVPQQRAGSPDGRGGAVGADATRAKGAGKQGDAHRPGSGELPLAQEVRGPGAGVASTGATPRQGQAAQPPASSLPAPRAGEAGGAPDASSATGIPGPVTEGVELPAERTEVSSVFVNPDGTKTQRVYSRPVHFKESDGSWADIDTDLAVGADGRLRETANSIGASFAPRADAGDLIALEIDATHRVAYSLAGAAPAVAQAKGDTVTYPLAGPATDVVYNALAQGIKESLVLRDASAPTSWVFPLSLTGLDASLGTSGEVRFTDSAGAIRLTIPQGFMEDAAKDPASGEGAKSGGVHYSLVEAGGRPALQMDLDAAWLHDASRTYPVRVDPTTSTNVNVGQSTYVMTGVNANFSSDSVLKVGTYNGGGQIANSYLYFPAVAGRVGLNYVISASVHMAVTHSYECKGHSVYIKQINSAWNPGSISTYPGVTIGQQLGEASFYGGDTCSNGVQWETIPIGGDPTSPGSQLVTSWANGGANYGLAVTASTTDSNAWKKFDSVNTGYPPYLAVTYSDWAADYTTNGSYTPPTSTASGSQQVTLKNLGANWWNSTSMQVKARIYDGNWVEQSVGAAPLTGVSGLVKTGESVTVNGVIPALPNGRSYILCWDGYVNGAASLHDSYQVPYHNCTWVSAQNVPPQIDTVEPLGNTVVGTLSPQLYAAGHDGDNYPGSGLQYQFQVYDGATLLSDSGWVANQSYAVPAGHLAWNESYTWTVRVFDGQASSAWSNPVPLQTAVQQPLITSRLGGSAGDGASRSFDAQVGNYTTAATDASVKAVGPALNVTRSYNSLDPRTSTLFGSGWSSLYDMGIVPDGDSSGSVVVTTASGRTERFGRNDFQLGQLAGVGDQTGDGIGDAVAVDTSTSKLWLFPGPGYSQAERRLLGEGWNGVSQITGADVNGDGVGDLYAVVNSDGSLRMYPGKAGGGFGEPVTVGAFGWNGMTGLAVTSPLAADGRKDLLAVEKSSGYLYAYPIAADGTTGPSTSLGFGWNGVTELVGGDFNHDGKGDVVGIQAGTGQLLEYPGTGNATLGTSSLAAPVQIGTGWTTMRDLATVNGLAGDAGTDILAVDRATGVPYLYHSGSAWSGPSRTTTGMALYTSPAGEYETLATDAAGGWVLADKTGTVYRFNQQAGSGYLLSRITDRQQHSQVLHYTGAKLDTVTDEASGRALHLTWTADGRHAASVYTDPAVGTDWNTAQTWTYTYDTANLDQLASVCTPPAGGNTVRPCTAYTYTAGSHLRSTVLDAGPSSYWRLGEASGTTAASEVIENQAVDKGTYVGVGLGSANGPLAGSATKAASFDGSTSSVTLPNGSFKNSYVAVGLWFRTTAPGVLVGYQNTALAGTPSHASSPLYIGTDGKLRGEFYGQSIGFNPITTTGTVTDGAWHFALLSGAGDTQTLYLDNQKVGTLAGSIDYLDTDFTYVGAGYTRGIPWPVPPTAAADGNNHFSGQIAEVALYQHPLGAPAVAAQWTAARNPSAELTKLALPSGKTKLAVVYDTVNDRASQVTDANGGVWTLNTPSVSGSEQAYRSAVLGSRPAGYWRLAEGAASQATNMITVPRTQPNNGTYSNVALGATGPMAGSAGAATFDGATSWAELPAAYAPTSGPGALGVWFRTTSPGVLISYQSFPIGAAPTSADDWNPALYVGTDNKLHGQFWTGSAAATLASTKNVTDGAWHLAILAADTPTSQTLYLDGATAAGPLNAAITPNGQAHVYVGAGTVSSGWPAAPATADGHFKGQIADVMAFDHGFAYTTTVSDLYTQATTVGAAAHDAAVIDAHPTGYWPFGDATGNQATERLSSAALAQNQGTYRNVTLGTPGPYATGGTTAATFNGTTSAVQLPDTAAPRIGNTAAVEVWFKTATAGVLYSHQSFALGTTPTAADKSNPVLYVGTDGKLHGQVWTGTAANTAVSDRTVNDNTWHMATLVAGYTGSTITQQLYVDGAPSGQPITGTPGYAGDTYNYLGAGTVTAASPAAPTDTSGHFNGSIADFAYFPTSLSASVVAAHWTAATGTPAQAVSQSANLRAQIILANPSGYWRLDEPAGATVAQDQLGAALPNQEHGTYTNVTLNTAGPAGAWDGTAATFNGTTSSLQLPGTAAPVKGPNSIELWFRTTKAGVLYGYQTFPLGAAHTGGKDRWNPALYVGSDGRLYGALWTGDAANALVSAKSVTDNAWHHAVIAGDDNGQALYLDGAQSAVSTTARQIYYNGAPYVYVGAGTADAGWPNPPTSPDGRFTGSIAGVAFYPDRLDADTVNAHYKAMGTSATPTKSTYSSATGPGGYVMNWRRDTVTGRLTSTADLMGATTRYSYDTHGYLHSVTDPDGHTTTTGYDERGNVVSSTTCTTAADCHTGYAEYYFDPINPFNPANDHRTSAGDARSGDAGDGTYTSRYTYNAVGDPLTTTLPATADFPNGRTATSTYTTGTEAAVGSTGTQPTALTATSTAFGGQTTRYAYDRLGNLASVTGPTGLVTTYAYDNLGRVTSQTDTCADCAKAAVTTTSTWDGQGNLRTRTDPATTDAVTGTVHTRRTTLDYDTDGNPVSQAVADTTGGDATRTTTTTYNTTNSLVSKTVDPAGRATSYTYDSYGRLSVRTDPAGTRWTYTWDPTGHLLRTAIGNYTGSPTGPVPSRSQLLESRAYDPAGRLATVTDAMGRTTHTYYNDDNTVAEVDLDGFHNPDGTQRNVVLQLNTYDAAGNLTQQTTNSGRTTAVTAYDAAGRRTSTTLDPGGLNRKRTYSYDASGNTLSSVLTAGAESRETDYTYNSAGQVLTETLRNQPADSITKNTYDQRGLPLTSVSPLGNVAGADPAAHTTTFTHDELGRLTVTTAPPADTTVFNTSTGQPVTLPNARAISRTGYNVHDEPTSTQDPTGNITTLTHTFDAGGEHHSTARSAYTAPGQSTSVTPVTQVDYDALGRVKTVHDAKNQLTTNVYDQLGNLVEVDAPAVDGTTPKSFFGYDLDREQLTATDPTGAQTQQTYDDLGRPVTSTELVRTAGQATAAYTTSFGYDDAGNLTSTIVPGGGVSTATFNAAGETTSSSDPLHNTTTTTYNLAGQPSRVTRPGSQQGSTGPSTSFTYDRAGRTTAFTQLSPTGSTLATSSVAYDPADHPVSSTDADGNTTTAVYDALDRLVRHVEPVGTGKTITTSYGYDAAGRRTAQTDGNANTTYTTYNSLGLPESTVEPATSAYPNLADRTYTTGYDQLARAVSLTEPGGVSVLNAYNPAGNLVTQSGSGGEAPTPTRTFGYDLDGRLTSLSAPGGTQTYAYDDRGLTASANGPMGNSTYGYNADGQLTARTDSSGTTGFTYDAAGHLKTLADPLTGQTTTYTYTPRGQVGTAQYGAGSTRTYAYDDQDNLTSDVIKTSTGTTVSSLGYTYLPSGRLKTKTTNGTTHTYDYDQAGRLSNWNNGTGATAYGYDGNGNLTADGTATATYNQRNQLVGTTTGANYTYTARGTRATSTSGGTTTQATYDAFDQLAGRSGQSYTYDALGRLSSTTGHTLTYDTTSATPVSDGTEKYTRTPGGTLSAIGTQAGSALALTDRHGDLIGTFTAGSTTLSGSSSYDPWGRPTATTGAGHNLGYQGGWTDSTSGQVSTASRWYDPATAGFTSRDTLDTTADSAVSANRYAYGSDDPLDYADPSGHSICVPPIAPLKGGKPPKGPSGPGIANPAPTPYFAPSKHRADPDDYTRAAYTQPDWLYQYQMYNLTHYNYGYSGSGGYGVDYRYFVAGGLGGASLYGLGSWASTLGWGFAALANPFSSHSCDTQKPVEKPKHDPTKDKPGTGNPHSDGGSAAAGTMSGQQNGSTLLGTAVNLLSGLAFNGADTGYIPVGVLSPELALGRVPGPLNANGNPVSCRAARPPGSVTDGSTGWILYGQLEAPSQHATAAEACLTGDPSGTRGSTAEVDPPGYNDALAYAGKFDFPRNPIARCHLIAREHGGAGDGPDAARNLVPCFQRTMNAGPTDSMREFEFVVGDAMKAGQAVHEVVDPVYAKQSDTIPMGVWMTAVGTYDNGALGMNEHTFVWNHALDEQKTRVDLWDGNP
ncbi:LamG-like jellyroll fold domain-containing protein [Kitasatospora sp. NPDC057223]|uniref:LamG-like jellyroll fold domain-containing protein n=1 Tax=Kitasatospora sp. NPDC057223 TaxID=3346055 RepID=UPI00363327A3